MQTNKGFLRTIILIIIALVILKLVGVDFSVVGNLLLKILGYIWSFLLFIVNGIVTMISNSWGTITMIWGKIIGIIKNPPAVH